MDKNKFGQYFTPEIIVDFMIGLSTISKKGKILEPSAGEGIFLKRLEHFGFTNLEGYEIDKTLKNISNSKIYYKSFLSTSFTDKFDLIIGNPPYIRWKNLEQELKNELEKNETWNRYFNSLCDYLFIFILKSIELLKENGELIFITPEYWLNTTHSQSLRNYMMENGCFNAIYHFNETPIFENVNASIIIFHFKKTKKHNKEIDLVKYYSRNKITKDILKSLLEKKGNSDVVNFFKIPQFKINARWLLASSSEIEEIKLYEEKCKTIGEKDLFNEVDSSLNILGDIVDIGNGLVSGLDKAFQYENKILNSLEKRSLKKVLKAKNLNQFTYEQTSDYIFLNFNEIKSEKEFKINYPNFYAHLSPFKEDLNKRYSYNKKIEYWEWVFLRSYNLFNKKSQKIFIPCKERISSKKYFRFGLVEPNIFPTQDVTAIVLKDNVRESIYYILGILNSIYVFDWMKYNGIVKGSIVEFSEKPLHSLPIKRINWKNKNEVSLHDEIVIEVKNIVENKISVEGSKYYQLMDKLLGK